MSGICNEPTHKLLARRSWLPVENIARGLYYPTIWYRQKFNRILFVIDKKNFMLIISTFSLKVCWLIELNANNVAKSVEFSIY